MLQTCMTSIYTKEDMMNHTVLVTTDFHCMDKHLDISYKIFFFNVPQKKENGLEWL